MALKVFPCIWYRKGTAEAFKFYKGVFEGSALTEPVAGVAQLDDGPFSLQALDGCETDPSPAISFYVVCKSEDQIDAAWEKLSEGGMVMLPLDAYPWSKRFGWCQDKYGVSWQITLDIPHDPDQRLTPTLMFVNDNFRRAEEAMKFHAEILSGSVIYTEAYPDSDEVSGGSLMHGHVDLAGSRLIYFDNGYNHNFGFTEAISLVVVCDTQEEIDNVWAHLTEGGSESMCGWCKDKFGISWQVVPAELQALLADESKSEKVIAAMMEMKKIDFAKLLSL